VTAPVNADGPSLALSVLAIAFALRYRDDPRLLNAVWVGLAVGGAMSIKALSGPAVVVAGLIVLTAPWPRRTGVRDAAIAAATALAVYLLVALPFGLGDVWDQSVTYHQDARDIATTGGAFKKVLTTLWDRDKLLVVALALAAIAYVVRLVVRRRAGRPGDRALTVVTAFFLLWTVILLALLVWEPALWRAHVAHLVPPLALLASLRPAPWKVLVVAGVVTVPFAIASNTNILWPDGYRGQQAAVVRRLETFASGARFISDEPGLVWRADRDIPGEFADASFLRIDDGRITQRSLVRGAAAHDVCGVLVTSAMHYGRFGGLADALVAEGYHPVRFGDEITLYERDSDFCRP
jgi:hypothetical protein